MKRPLRLPFLALAASALSLAGCATAQEAEPMASAPVPPVATGTQRSAPQLVVAISVDQLSADLFQQYRRQFTGGLARLQNGAVFQNGYQAHAATETCPGHSTLLTGKHPANTGIIANGWADFTVARNNKEIYCAEDATQVPEEGAGRYVASSVNLLVPTLGEMLKTVSPASRNVAVSGKDRGALMMGGTDVDAIAWWTGRGFGPDRGGAVSAPLAAVNARVEAALAEPASGGVNPIVSWCDARRTPVVEAGHAVGANPMAQTADPNSFRISPRLDEATLDLAGRLVAEMNLGGGSAPDILSISLSATDYIGHAFGTNGAESCVQMAALDSALEGFFKMLDGRGVDYLVVLTADHGGLDLPERAQLQAVPDARRVDNAITPEVLGERLAGELGLSAPALIGESAAGDIYLNPALSAADRARVLPAALAAFRAHRDVAGAYSSAEIMATPLPTGDPREWSLLERLRASHYPGRSGDILVALKPEVTPIVDPSPGYVATHGSPWDYDRRVPILFWRRGMAPFEQPLPAMTVDIAPTLASQLHLNLPASTFDGRCLDLDSGTGNTCE